MASSVTPPLSIGHGVRFVTDPGVTMEEALLAVGEQVGFDNISHASRMNKAAVVFLKDERLVHNLIESGVFINDLFVQVSPLSVPSTRVVVSGVPPFIPNELIEQELRRFGKFASGLRTVTLGCKDARLKHVISLRRQVFMFLDSPTQSLDVSFKIKHEGGYYTVYANSGSMKCFECGDVGHKRLACPHRVTLQAERVENNIEQTPEVDQQVVVASSSVSTVQGDHSVINENIEINQDGKGGDVSLEQSISVENDVVISKDREITGEQISETEIMGESVPVEDNALDASQEKEVVTLLNVGSQVESDAEEMEQEESEGEGFDGSSRAKDLYSLEEINDFLDKTFGQSVKVDDHFDDIEKFIRSVAILQKMVGFDLLDERKRYRLRKHVTGLKKFSKSNKNRKGKKSSSKK